MSETRFLEYFIAVELEDVYEIGGGTDGMHPVVSACARQREDTPYTCSAHRVKDFMERLAYFRTEIV